MIDLNLCKEGDKLKTIHGTILTYICKLPPGSYYEHKIQYPDGSFGTRTIGIGKTVTSTSNITGSASGNYSLTQPTGLTADITTKTLTLASVSAQSKVYDGLNTATVSATLIGVIPTDDVTLSLVGTFADKNVANPISVNVVPSISGFRRTALRLSG